MTIEEITQIVKSYIKQSAEGLEIENPKCDFKAQWYDLSNKKGINEFLKDTSAIANTFGLDGLVIIGYDNKTNKYHDTTFRDSKLSDTSKITDLINKKIDRLFDINIYDIQIDNHNLSILHIPPSLDKPHVIISYQTFDKEGDLKKEEQQRIFVRKGTSTYPASKNDLELMFYDRKNIIPEYKILTSYHTDTLDIWFPGTNEAGNKNNVGIRASISIAFENIGRRPIAINEITYEISIFENPREYQKIEFISVWSGLRSERKTANIIVHPNEIKNELITFVNKDNHTLEKAESLIQTILTNKHLIKTNYLMIRLSDGRRIQSELIKTND